MFFRAQPVNAKRIAYASCFRKDVWNVCLRRVDEGGFVVWEAVAEEGLRADGARVGLGTQGGQRGFADPKRRWEVVLLGKLLELRRILLLVVDAEDVARDGEA